MSLLDWVRPTLERLEAHAVAHQNADQLEERLQTVQQELAAVEARLRAEAAYQARKGNTDGDPSWS